MKFIVQTGDASLKQQMDTLLDTRVGSVPADRDFGISWNLLGEPPEVAESLFYQELLDKTERYVPDVKIQKVMFQADGLGEAQAVVYCRRREED